MKYYIIAGEASGDLHASNLMKHLNKLDEAASFRCWGGDLMEEQSNTTLVKHYRDLAFMGFVEVLMNLRTITKNLDFCKQDIEQFKPDVIIFIDYPGFNMRIAKWAKKKGYKTHYYISPQIWAWKENRIHAIKRDVDSLYVILPFEKTFYEEKHQFPVKFVGHPLIDAIAQRDRVDEVNFRKEHQLDDRPIIALLPGSRKQEIKKMLTTMLAMVNQFDQYQFVIAGAPSQPKSFYETFLKRRVHFAENKTYDLLSIANAALVTSGTATLETALFKVPQVVCYKGSWISYQIGKRLVKHIKYISLVNLIMNKEVVKELIQSDFNTKTLTAELANILSPEVRESIYNNYFELEQKLGGQGASASVAQHIINALKQ